MRVYCWYKPLETAQIRRKKDGNSEVLLISLIRNVMISIICDFYVNSLTRKDFMLLLSCCLSCVDHEQVFNLILPLNKFSDKPYQISTCFDTSQALTCLQALVMSSNEFVSTTILQLIVSLHSKKLISSLTLYEHMEMIFHNIKECRLTQEMLMKFADIIQPAAPILFLICCYIEDWTRCESPNDHTKHLA